MRNTLVGTFKNKEAGQDEEVRLCYIRSVGELEPPLPSLVHCYKTVFAGPPYHENYDGQEKSFIIPTFKRFVEDGILILLVAGENQNGSVIGFGAGIGADKSEVAEFLNQHTECLDAPIEKYLYMAELGVLPAFQGQGLGTLLVRARIEAAITESGQGKRFSFTHLIMRTARTDNNSKSIYQKLGAREISGLVQNKSEFATESTSRIFLAASLRTLNI